MATRQCLDCGYQREDGKACLQCRRKADREAAEMIRRGHWVPGMAVPGDNGDTSLEDKLKDMF